jgi:hypothetical protein
MRDTVNLRSLALMVFIFAASAALAGYVGMKYGEPGSQQQVQHATPPARPAPPARPSPSAGSAPALPNPDASVAPPMPARETAQPLTLQSAPEKNSPQDVPPPARNTMEPSRPGTVAAPIAPTPNTAAPNTTTGARDAEAPKCNKDACASAYRSFDPADCTYLPANGPRRICKK